MRPPKMIRRMIALKKAEKMKIDYEKLMTYILPIK